MKNDEEMISTTGIMYKIKSFFKNLFKKKEKTVEDPQENIVEEKSAFEESIAVKTDDDRARILELQQKFREGKLTADDVTEEDVNKLTELYNEQIAELNKQIEQDTAIIEKCNKDIEEYKKRKI